jgi:hypothetical protein
MNFARRSLLPGERCLEFVFQPEITIPRLDILGRQLLKRVVCTAHLLILTDRELTLISDDPTGPQILDDRHYGGIWTYIPLQRIAAATVKPEVSGRLRLILQMVGGTVIETLFGDDQCKEVNSLVATLLEEIFHNPGHTQQRQG